MNETVIDEPKRLSTSNIAQYPTFDRNILTVAKGGGITFVGKLFLAGARFVTAVLLARLLGAEQYGLYNLALSTGTLASGLALLGLDDAVLRYVAISTGRQDDARSWGTLQVCIGIAMFASVLPS